MNIVVLRALMLGDMLCATPALRALRAGLPQARIALLGLPWARTLAERLDSVDEFIEFPGWPGLPEREVDEAALPAWIDAMRDRRFALTLQLHGSGGIVNGLLAQFGATRAAGFSETPGVDPGFLAWPSVGSEVERLLALTTHLGLPPQGTALDFPLRAADRAEAATLLAPLGGRPFVLLHPGSQLPSRRWPPARFAAVANRLARQDLALVLTGTAGERALTAGVAAALDPALPVLDLSGLTSLWTLGAVVEQAALVLCNDTGLSHVAAALRRPSVVVASGSEVARWAPADTARHRVLWQDRACRPCGERICPHAQEDGHSACGLAVDSASVLRAARDLLEEEAPCHA